MQIRIQIDIQSRIESADLDFTGSSDIGSGTD